MLNLNQQCVCVMIMFFAHNELERERDDDDACGQGTALPQQQILFYPEDREIQKRVYEKKQHI